MALYLPLQGNVEIRGNFQILFYLFFLVGFEFRDQKYFSSSIIVTGLNRLYQSTTVQVIWVRLAHNLAGWLQAFNGPTY